nr:immunoglobulin light chain junction region [Macaca mulatta]MOW05587.1 immunoglobulin light chain junction region [Macaca mulatta]
DYYCAIWYNSAYIF